MSTAYEELLLSFKPRPIDSEREYKRAIKYIEKNLRTEMPKAEGDLIDMLAVLVADYEARHYPEPGDVPPAEMLQFFIEERGITKAEVARETGIAKQTLTNVLSGDRAISKANAVKFGKFFHCSPALFL